jgi:hypothetical protein
VQFYGTLEVLHYFLKKAGESLAAGGGSARSASRGGGGGGGGGVQRYGAAYLPKKKVLRGARLGGAGRPVGSRAPIRRPLPLLGSATGSQGSLRRMSHEKQASTDFPSQCSAHNSTELLELAAKD